MPDLRWDMQYPVHGFSGLPDSGLLGSGTSEGLLVGAEGLLVKLAEAAASFFMRFSLIASRS